MQSGKNGTKIIKSSLIHAKTKQNNEQNKPENNSQWVGKSKPASASTCFRLYAHENMVHFWKITEIF